MHHEYAVDPKALVSSWENCRYISEKFGFDRGRVLSLFPKRWLKNAYEKLGSEKEIGDVEKKRISLKLSKLAKECAIPSGRGYDPSEDWLHNAINQQNQKPFHAIIIKEKNRGDDDILSLNDIDESHELMCAKTNYELSRKTESLLAAFAVLFKSSARIAFIDPYFDICNQGYRNFLERCLTFIDQFNPKEDIDIAIHYDGEKIHTTPKEVGNNFTANFHIIPNRLNIQIFAWEKLINGEDFHDRFLLTNKGGMSIGRGFKPTKTHMTTNVSLMDSKDSLKKLDSFSLDTKDYKLIECPIKIFSDGRCL
ncbi:MAG: hypothetical protein OXC62_11615 [Aestuariivita sp.]|nr:hypothetical protein [Aestuariivita sp.]